MKIKFYTFIATLASTLLFAACNDGKTYMELREEEDEAIEKFLTTDGRYTAPIPSNLEFITAQDSEKPPYYILPDGVYMQIQSMGVRDTTGKFFRANDKVYFRYNRMNLKYWADGISSLTNPDSWAGNWSDASGTSDSYYFTYTTYEGSNYSSYYEYGLGIEYPLKYVGNGAIVNLVMPSKMGFSNEISSVIPYLYKIRYALKEN